MPNAIDLEGRVAVVTGGAQGIGRAVVDRLAASGATVSIWDIDPALAQAAAAEVGAPARAVVCDVGDWTSVEFAHQATIEEFGRIDVLVNNAGIAGGNSTTWETSVEEWRRVLRINLDGPFLCCKAVVPTMIDHGYGRIVNIASIAGKEGNPNAAHYSASKAGVIALTKSLAKEVAGHNISVNAITPAAARTAIFEQMTPDHIEYMLSKIPLGRFVEVEEIAALVAFAASEECSFTTGSVLDISGGRATY
jgi:3-oxoacyl-[acyl-carrier protein] reductase